MLKTVEQYIEEFIDKHAYKTSVIIIFIALLVFIVLVSVMIIAVTPINEEIYNIVSILILFLSLISGFLYFAKTKALQIRIEQVKFTNDFVDKFVEVMEEFDHICELKINFMYKNEKIKSLYEKISNEKTLEFDEEYFRNLLEKTDLSFETVSTYFSRNSKLKDENYYEMMKAFCLINSRNNVSEKIIRNRDFIEKIIDDIEEVDNIFVKTSTNILNRYENELINKLEAMLFNVQFNLLDYDKLFDLIVVPYENVVRCFYIEIMIRKIKANKKERKVYSNIELTYNEFQKVKNDKTRSNTL